MKRLPHDCALLAEDETVVRLLPELRRRWSLRGAPAPVPISGRNDQRALFGVLDLRSGRHWSYAAKGMRQEHFITFLQQVRRRYGPRPVAMILDRAPLHTARRVQAVACELKITLVFLPKQWPELNAMDQLWKILKGSVLANQQWDTIQAHIAQAQEWLADLTAKTTLHLAGVLAPTYWLRSVIT